MFDGSKEVTDSRPHDVYKFLESEGFEVYFQGQHKGKCNSKYVVIVERGETKLVSISSTTSTIELLCYVPIAVSSTIGVFCDSVKEAMKGMFPMIVPLYNDIGDYTDDEVKATMRTIQYRYYRKIER